MSTPSIFKARALQLARRGIVAIPLTLDHEGRPKRPFTDGWQRLSADPGVIAALPWERAKGMGIALGDQSRNLCVLDIDDEGLAALLIGEFRGQKPPYVVRTFRKRCHVYVRARQPAISSQRTIAWDGHQFNVELRATGNQVAAPPTPGYSVALNGKPYEAATIEQAWESILGFLLNKYPARLRLVDGGTGGPANYPSPWRPDVPKEERNKTLYIEAHRLREAGMPLDEAIEILRIRIESSYQKGEFSWHEAERTIRSAYRKGVKVSPRPIFESATDRPFHL